MDVKKIAKLARLEITDEEAEMYTPQMAGIVSYIEQLNELDTKGIEPMSGGFTTEGQTTQTVREDVPAGSFTSEEALSQAPGSAEGLFRVPKVL
jgi:aspartyl-tRNA(Asn)/glutamyl-tRNA(Gln) amidotransferase subunit C